MKDIFQIAGLLVNADHWAMARGAALSIAVLVMGAALLGLSGWFITATGLAGLAGIGIAFDVFRPSAGVRFLALGRAAARYGERLLTHDATLRALAALRVVLLRGHSRGDAKALSRLRGEGALTRIISDVDALDGIILRLVLPLLAALVTHLMVFLVLGWLVGWSVASSIILGYLCVGAVILFRLARASIAPSSEAEEASQLLRRGVIDMIRDREALILAGQLPDREIRLRKIDAHARKALRKLDLAERNAGFAMSVVVAAVAIAAFLLGAVLLDQDSIGPAKATIGFFVALALAEALLPLRRGVSDLGRMHSAATRVAPQISVLEPMTQAQKDAAKPLLSIEALGLSLNSGDAVALTGPSGVGKSILLMQIAGLVEGDGIEIHGHPPRAYSEDHLREIVSALPQRSALVAGTVRDNLSLAGAFDDQELWRALETVALADDLRKRDGLDTRLGEGGSGLSGGQSRRLALARNILKKSAILLFDEPTEGLDTQTADIVLTQLRTALPDTLIVAVMHSGADHEIFTQKRTL